MSRRSDIVSEIHNYQHKIDVCREKISRLMDESAKIEKAKAEVEEEAYVPNKSYDMTVCEKWRGKLETEAEEYQKEINRQHTICLNDTSNLLSDIQRIIERLNEMIEEYEERISELEAELTSLPDNE